MLMERIIEHDEFNKKISQVLWWAQSMGIELETTNRRPMVAVKKTRRLIGYDDFVHLVGGEIENITRLRVQQAVEQQSKDHTIFVGYTSVLDRRGRQMDLPVIRFEKLFPIDGWLKRMEVDIIGDSNGETRETSLLLDTGDSTVYIARANDDGIDWIGAEIIYDGDEQMGSGRGYEQIVISAPTSIKETLMRVLKGKEVYDMARGNGAFRMNGQARLVKGLDRRLAEQLWKRMINKEMMANFDRQTAVNLIKLLVMADANLMELAKGKNYSWSRFFGGLGALTGWRGVISL